MKTDTLLVLTLILSSLVQLGSSLIIEGVVIGAAALFGYAFRCKYSECCDKEYIPRNTSRLRADLQQKLYGQQIAGEIIYSSIYSHVHHANPRKPLALSFHGLPGSGKNYVVTMIANALFKSGEKSSYFHFFNGRADFPSDRDVELYKHNLREKVQRALDSCERSLFVFDEVDKMPAGVLDVLVPFLDYTSWRNELKSKSIFIFLSNTGSDKIVKRMIDLWQSGKDRDETTIQDFETLIAIGAFNEKGGLYKSGTIESKLIDHHVPFLPMEEKHIIECLKDIFEHWGISNPSEELIREALKHVTYGPPPHNLYSTAGCKRLDYKVSYLLHKNEF